MKKIILFLAVIILSISILTSCDIVGQIIGTPDVGNTEKCSHIDADDDYFCDKCGDTYFDGDEIEDEPNDEKPEDKPEDDKKPEDDGNGGADDKENHLYNSFTPSERTLFTQLVGEVIPFS